MHGSNGNDSKVGEIIFIGNLLSGYSFCTKFYQIVCRSIITVAFVARVQVGPDVVDDARAPRHCDQNPGGHGKPHLHSRHRHVHLRCNWNAAVLNHIH